MARKVKRVVDIIISVCVLVVLSPVCLLIIIILKSKGNAAIYASRRLGLGGQEFHCLKFRTMQPEAERLLPEILAGNPAMAARWQTHRKLYNDPRTTAFGRFLRKNSLDEIPQFINVLKGEMSVVGPRPILRDEVAFFDEAQLALYYSVRPGITGFWQVNGRNNRSFTQRVLMDQQYITNWSLWNDIVIMFKTIGVLWRRSGVY